MDKYDILNWSGLNLYLSGSLKVWVLFRYGARDSTVRSSNIAAFEYPKTYFLFQIKVNWFLLFNLASWEKLFEGAVSSYSWPDTKTSQDETTADSSDGCWGKVIIADQFFINCTICRLNVGLNTEPNRELHHISCFTFSCISLPILRWCTIVCP